MYGTWEIFPGFRTSSIAYIASVRRFCWVSDSSLNILEISELERALSEANNLRPFEVSFRWLCLRSTSDGVFEINPRSSKLDKIRLTYPASKPRAAHKSPAVNLSPLASSYIIRTSVSENGLLRSPS